MQSAIDNIKATYDYETCKEIVDHGCQSGVCHEHIYYGDTVEYFNKYENEIIDFIDCSVGNDTLLDLFKRANYDLTYYKNEVVWMFIELVAMQVVDDVEGQDYNDNKTIEDYVIDPATYAGPMVSIV